MRKLLLSLLLISVAPVAYAQEAALTTPVTRSSEAKYKVRSFSATTVGTNTVQVDISVQDSGNAEIRSFTAVVPDPAHPGATFAGAGTALNTIRSGETGSDMRKLAFRLLGYLADNGYFPGTTAPTP